MININWEEVYNGTIRDSIPSTDMWGSFQNTSIIDGLLEHLNDTNPNALMKFDQPIGLIPWTDNYLQNVSLTLEWLVRDHRRAAIRLCAEPLCSHVKEHWYHCDFDEGIFYHVCYPKDILNYRVQYESAYSIYKYLPPKDMSSEALQLIDSCKNLLWIQWKCIGKDGEYTYKINKNTNEKELYIKYRYLCSRCGSDMPKSIRMFTLLTQTKLKDVVS